ncbi:amino acid ABC transporter ATP-binding protein [Roseovarius sp. A21]|uniref:Amino acid ABC transporter ATP-binding protein n=1 Tax=Roseovarius bejariae TaxID=2576383 RepID=A0A844CP65_9RHOB|nr:amino acid ABC transporter ATP-binding protein [Roseovarius bejariae]MRU16627.1 amino acid ABC transporter ATP-binding protein [Roseovarius bejariae]
MLLDVKNIHKKYGEVEVLKGVSLTLARGETKVIMGPSGTGKSTLLRCINRLSPPTSGEVFLDGELICDANINEMRQKVAFVFQDFNLFLHLSALDNVAMGPMRLKGMKRAEARELAMQELQRVGMQNHAASYPAQLSGGQQQRVSIARALAMKPEVILFDEPTSALDPELTGEVVTVMQKLAADGITMLVVSHEIGFARRAADAIIFMEGGHVIEEGAPEQIIGAPRQDRTREFLNMIAEEGQIS